MAGGSRTSTYVTDPLQAIVRPFVAARCGRRLCSAVSYSSQIHERRGCAAPSRSPGDRCARPKAALGAVCVWPRMHRDGAGVWGRRAYCWRWRSSDCAVRDLMGEVLSLRKRPDRQVHAERTHDVLSLRIRFGHGILGRRGIICARAWPLGCWLFMQAFIRSNHGSR
jgi:hypothetical protein